MTQAISTTAMFTEEELCALLEQMLGEYYAQRRRIVALKHQPSIYVSSFAIEALDVQLENGERLELLLKDLNAASDTAQQVKPAFVRDPMREIEVYRRILPQSAQRTPKCYGALAEPARSRYLLLLENVAGLELYHVGEFQVWEHVARRLAHLHNEFAARVSALDPMTHLLRYDHAFYTTWMQRALEFAKDDAAERLAALSRNYETVIERLLRLPRTLIHGEFYASNVLVEPTMRGLQMCPVDWEMAALAPGLMDVAALAAGNWTEEQKKRMVRAYYAESVLNRTLSEDKVLNAFDDCRLHQAVQWLGWARDWDAPPEHAHNWLSDAFTLAEQRGLLK